MSRKLLLLFTLLLLVVPVALAQDAEESPITFIELAGSAAEGDAEISSLYWYGDTLLLMTENPFIYASEGNVGAFFALDKEDILDYLAEDDPEPLEPWEVPIWGSDIMQTVSGFGITFDGFEAAAIVDNPLLFGKDQIYLTIEADNNADDTMRGYVVSGSVEPGLSGITLDLNNFIALPHQTDFNNMSYESLVVVDNSLIALYEANGAGVNADAAGYVIDLSSGEVSSTPLDNIEYRVTDATTADEDGVFWVINYFFTGEDFLAAEDDPIFDAYGMGASQAEFDGFERLVALQVTDDGIVLVDAAPMQLLMTEDSRGRNWEGIARLDDMGVLVVTDKYPQTLLGFVSAE